MFLHRVGAVTVVLRAGAHGALVRKPLEQFRLAFGSSLLNCSFGRVLTGTLQYSAVRTPAVGVQKYLLRHTLVSAVDYDGAVDKRTKHTSEVYFDGETYIDQMTMKSGCNNRITGLGTMSNTGQWLVFATTGALLLLQQQVVRAQVPGVVECNNPRKS